MPGQVAFLGVSLVHLIKSPNLANGYIYILYIYIIYVLYILYIYIYIICNIYQIWRTGAKFQVLFNLSTSLNYTITIIS